MAVENPNDNLHPFKYPMEYIDLLENTVECIWIFNCNTQQYKYISASIYKLRGITVEEAMNESLGDSLTPESIEKIKSAGMNRYPRFLAGDRSDEVVNDISEYQQYCKGGSIKDVEISTKLAIDEATGETVVIGVSRDITERKKRERELLKRLSIIESSESNVVLNKLPRIFCFGDFRAFGSGCDNPVQWRTAKARELFAFLFHKRDTLLSKWKICEALWPESTAGKVETYLHTTLYKMKKDLISVGINVCIKYKNGYYQCIFPEIYSDVVEFEEILKDFSVTPNCIDEIQEKKVGRALKLYNNGYFQEDAYTWSYSKSILYQKQIHPVMLMIAKYYISNKSYGSAKQLLLKMIENNSLDEAAHELLLQLYIYEEDRAAFKEHYQQLQETLFTELGILPQESIRLLYNSFLK